MGAVLHRRVELDPMVPSPAANHAQQRYIVDSITNTAEIRVSLKEQRHSSLQKNRSDIQIIKEM